MVFEVVSTQGVATDDDASMIFVLTDDSELVVLEHAIEAVKTVV